MNQDYDKIAAMRVALALDALHTEGLSDAERIEAAMEVLTSTAAYRKLLNNRIRDHDAEHRARYEIADAALDEAQEHGE